MAVAAEIFAQAVQLHQGGDLRGAESLYRQILALDGNHADARHLLGVLVCQMGDHAQAVRLIQRAIQLNPNVAAYYSNLGVAYEGLGQLEATVACYRQALELDPFIADAHNNLGNVLQRQHDWKAAAEHYRHALRLRPDFAEAHNNLGVVLLDQKQFEQAIESFRFALQLSPRGAVAWKNLGIALKNQGALDEAVHCLRQAVALNAEFAEGQFQLGLALEAQGELTEAIACYREAVRLQPGAHEAHDALGSALANEDHWTDAIGSFRYSLRIHPDNAPAASNLGALLMQQGDFDEAMGWIDHAIRLNPDHAEAHFNRAIAHLVQGRWREAWPEYEWRIKTKPPPRRAFDRPHWDGSPLDGRRILLMAEQGLGDTIQFIRYAPLVRARGGVVIVWCQPVLQRLLADFRGMDQFVWENEPIPEFDVFAWLLSLPGLVGAVPADVPADIPYLNADAGLTEKWRQELNSQCGDCFKIAVCWQGNVSNCFERLRSIPWTSFAPLARLENVRLISLQKGPAANQLHSAAGQIPVLDLGEQLDRDAGAFMDTAAIMKCVDLVISSDTAIPHLAGALGVPVWVALPLVPDWRWLLRREDTPWYPTMRLFRQTEFGKWDDVFARMAELVAQMITRGRK